MVFCKIIRKIVGTAAPVDKELAFMDSVFDPIEAHVIGLGATLLDVVDGYACGAGIVSLKCVPTSTSLLTSIFPPIARIISLAS